MRFLIFLKNHYDNSGILSTHKYMLEKILLNYPVFTAAVIDKKLHQGIHVLMVGSTNQAAAITLLYEQSGVDQFCNMV